MDKSSLSDDETLFLHMLLSRDQGCAQARNPEPSPRLLGFQAKGLIDLVKEDGATFIVVTAKGMSAMNVSRKPGV